MAGFLFLARHLEALMHNHLIYRLVIVDTCCTAALVFGWNRGLVDMVIAGDQSYICVFTFAVFLLAKAAVYREAVKVSRRLNARKTGEVYSLNADKAMAKVDYLFDFPVTLQTLGLLGTVVGLLMGLHGISGNTDDLEAIIWQLLGGLSTAFYTTAVGIILAEWIKLNIRPINTALVCLVEDSK
jgi:hypothetical protein